MKKINQKHNEKIQYQILKYEYEERISTLIASNKYSPYLLTTVLQFVPNAFNDTTCQYPFLSAPTWDLYSKLYRHLLSQLDRRYHRKHDFHPLTFDFLDINGSRGNPFAALTERTIPHVHSIYLVHEKTLPRFEELANSRFESIVHHPSIAPYVSSIDAQPFELSDLPQIVSYCSKFYDNAYVRNIRDDLELFNQFPDHTRTQLKGARGLDRRPSRPNAAHIIQQSNQDDSSPRA